MAHGTTKEAPVQPATSSEPQEIWLGPAQRAALEHIFGRRGHKHVEGPPACGKTTLLKHAQGARPGDVVLLLDGPRERADEVLTALLSSTRLGPWDLHETDQRNLLTMFFQQRRAEQKRIFVLVDDAHRFGFEAWRELERLCLLKDGGGPVFELTAVTRSGRAPPFEIGADMARHTMPSLGPRELKGYLRWRIGRFFDLTDDALRLAHTVGAGRYGAVDALCRVALELRGQAQTPLDLNAMRSAARALADHDRQPSGAVHRAAQAPHSPAADDARGVPGGRLIAMYHENVIQTAPLKGRLLLGRSPQCDIPLGSAAVSRFHAVVVGTPERFFVVDLNSKNGVLLNGTPVGKVELCDQDILKIGPFHIRVALDEALERDALPARQVETAAMPRPRREQGQIRLIT